MTDEREWCKNPHCTDLDCPVHSTPESKPEADVVERLEKQLAHGERHIWTSLESALQDALTLIHDLTESRWKIAKRAEELVREGSKLKAENERLREALEEVEEMGIPFSPADSFEDCQKIARQALTGEQK